MDRTDHHFTASFFSIPSCIMSVPYCIEMEEHDTLNSSIQKRSYIQLNIYFTNLHAFVAER